MEQLMIKQPNTNLSNTIDSENYAAAPLSGFYGAHVIIVTWWKNERAMTLPGIGIFIGPKDARDRQLMMHEFGHILQAKQYGILYWYNHFAGPSVESANNNGVNGHVHQTFWTEADANQLSSGFFKGLPWSNKRFPLDRKPEIPLPEIAPNDVYNSLF